MNVMRINKDWMEIVKYIYITIKKLCGFFLTICFPTKYQGFYRHFRMLKHKHKSIIPIVVMPDKISYFSLISHESTLFVF